MLSCAEAEKQIEEALLRGATAWTADVQSHLDGCAACRGLVEVDALLHVWPEAPPMPSDLVAHVMAGVVAAPPVRSRRWDVAAAFVVFVAAVAGVWFYVAPESVVSVSGVTAYLSSVANGFDSLVAPLVSGLGDVWNFDVGPASVSNGLAAGLLLCMGAMLSYLNLRWARVQTS